MVVQIVVYRYIAKASYLARGYYVIIILAVPGLSVGHVPHVSIALEVGGHVTAVRFGGSTERGALRLALST